MRKPSLPVLVLRYLYDQHPDRQSFTGAEMFEAQAKAKAYWDTHTNARAIHNAVLRKHGYTPKEWQGVLANSATFYFLPSDREEACNRDMKLAMKKLPIINQVAALRNYFYDLLKNSAKRRTIRRERLLPSAVYYYYLPGQRSRVQPRGVK